MGRQVVGTLVCVCLRQKNMHYTIDQSPKIDAKVENDQEYINSYILDLLGDQVHSILLCGGFGRGEGTVEVRNDEIHVVNDYDITIVLKERNRLKYAGLYRKYHAPLEALAVKLAKDLQMKQIDLGLKHFSYFEKPAALKIENYEVKRGHVFTYGDENPTRLMPDWKAEDIPLFEGTWLFRNRGAGMLIPALYFMRDEGIPAEKKENFAIECNKAQLAMGDSILLLNRCYHHLYSERLRFLDKLDVSDVPDGEKIVMHYREALEQKLQPEFQKFYKRDLKEWWFEIVRLLDIFYQYFETKRLGSEFKDWIEYADLHKPEDRFETRNFLKNIIRNSSALFSKDKLRMNYRKAKKSFTITLVPLILFSLQEDTLSLPYMTKAASLLGVSMDRNGREDWLNLSRTFLHEWHPGGEAVNAIKL